MDHAVLRRLRTLQDRGEVVRTRPQHSRSQTYALIQRDDDHEWAAREAGSIGSRAPGGDLPYRRSLRVARSGSVRRLRSFLSF